jgi:ankyrin repeat protein
LACFTGNAILLNALRKPIALCRRLFGQKERFMFLGKVYLLALGTVCLAIAACAHGPSNSTNIVLSYYESPGNCEDCPVFQVDFHSGGDVEFHGLRGCAVPGVQHYRIPEAKFLGLVRAFQDAHFFDIPRLDTTRAWKDVSTIRLTYKDERRIHETVDTFRDFPRLTKLERQVRDAAEVDRFLKPSVALYQELLGSGWDVNTLGEDHENALAPAVSSRDLESVRFLLQHGATVSKQALLASAFTDNVGIVKLLLAARNPDLKSPEGRRLLVTAARSSDITRFLLENGADVNSRDPETGETPLMAAVGTVDSFKLLLARGADVNATDNSGRSALWAATVMETNTGFITLLAEHGANVNAQDFSGRTALMNASDMCRDWEIKALLAVGADPSVADKSGRTALQPEVATSHDPKCKTSRDLLESANGRPRSSSVGYSKRAD